MLNKLIKLLQLTTSDNDAEALSAIRAANRLLKKERLDWLDVVHHVDNVTIAAHVFDKRAYNNNPRYGTPTTQNGPHDPYVEVDHDEIKLLFRKFHARKRLPHITMMVKGIESYWQRNKSLRQSQYNYLKNVT